MTAPSMAEVLAEHAACTMVPGESWQFSCGITVRYAGGLSWVRREHVAQALAAAGFGHVASVEREHRDLVSRLGFGDNISEPMADNDTIVAWFEQQSRDANEWQESQLWRNDCYVAGHPQDDDCHECDPALRLEAAEAQVADLQRWKDEALPVMAGLQELGRALGLPLGERITGERALEAVKLLMAQIAAVRALVSDWQANGNAGACGDPSSAVWHKAARQLLAALDGEATP